MQIDLSILPKTAIFIDSCEEKYEKITNNIVYFEVYDLELTIIKLFNDVSSFEINKTIGYHHVY